MALLVADEIACAHVADATLVNITGSDVPCCDEVAEPSCGVGIDFIVIRRQLRQPRETRRRLWRRSNHRNGEAHLTAEHFM